MKNQGERYRNNDDSSPLASQASVAPVNGSSIRATRLGLQFPDRPIGFPEWQQAGLKIARMADSSAWYMGDWLAYGEAQFENKYRRAAEAVGLNYQTLRNFAWVARRFPLSRRRDKLTFYHHMEVAKLSDVEQERWLDRAVRERWSVRRLRQCVKNASCLGTAAEDATPVMRKISADRTRVDRWRAAAEQVNNSLDDWILLTLDDAACQLLDT
ncbi:LmbU family transcriptional regulator [Amycolatopsis samaneae]|uniref:LmbU family transcriptional regulator n=1 Tax=Amycolatopsis samaneae TaxID=664691 RepID=A0ABW5GX05_9PSEU